MSLMNKFFKSNGEIVEQEYMSEEFCGEELEYMSEEFCGEELEYMSEEFCGEEELEEYMGEEGPRVLFGNINPVEANVSPNKVWNVVDNNLGLFFIVDANEEVMSKGIRVLTKDNVQIWSSPIKKLPKDSLILEGIEGDIYISARTISRVELEEEVNGNYFVTVDDSEVEAMVLKIEGLSKSEELLKEDDSYVEDNSVENVFADESTVEEAHTTVEDDMKEVRVENNGSAVEVTHELEVLKVALNTCSFTSSVSKCENANGTQIGPTDCKNYAAELRDSDIIIEKIDDKYVVTLNNVAKKPIQLFDGECPYFIVDNKERLTSEDVKAFIAKLKVIVCRTYGLDSLEFDKLKISFVSDCILFQSSVCLDNEYLRVWVVNNLPIKDGSAIIDLTSRGCNINYRYDNKVLRVTCFGLEGEDLVRLYEDLNGLIKLLGRENVHLIGFAANEEVYNILKRENNDCTIHTVAKLVRMQ